jgi:tripeptidyl-peptidase II
VLNLSFGVGNEQEGHAAIDSMVNDFLAAHPDVVLAISAGNDGPGISTLGFPGSADLALSVGALEPGAFTRAPQPGPPPPDRMGWWSSRGGDLGKPDVVAPGQAFSSVPHWNLGDEIKSGTSMAAPQMAGFVACLLSAMTQEGRHVAAADLAQAIRATAAPLRGWTALDQGAGVPRLEDAYRWLVAGHQGSRYVVRTAAGEPAALWRDGFAGTADTTQQFVVHHVDGLRAAQFLLTSDAAWLAVPSVVTVQPRETPIPVLYHPGMLKAPGVYVGVVEARNPTDTTAGPLFTLVSTVVVPVDLGTRPFLDSSRVIAPGRTQRYFVRVPRAGTTLRVAANVADSDEDGLLMVYDPAGRPASADPDSLVTLGFGKTPAAVVTVPAEEMDAGVYEIDLVNPGTQRISVTLRARVAPVALGVGTGGSLEASNAGASTVTLRVSTALAGAERRAEITGRGGAAESLAVVVPDWAARGEVYVQMPGAQWNRFTDLGVTVFDSVGQQVHATPMNYARGRQSFDVPPRLAGHAALIELFPAFAAPNSSEAWRATVRVRFFEDSLTPLGADQSVDVVSGGRATLPAVTVPALTLPDAFLPLVRRRLVAVADTQAVAVDYQVVRP